MSNKVGLSGSAIWRVACLALVCWGFGLGPSGAAEEEFVGPARVASRLLLLEDESAIGPQFQVNARVVQQMVDRLITKLTGRSSAAVAWRSLLSPTDVIGLKVSTAGRTVSGTRLATALAVVQGLRAAGFPREQIVVWDRSMEDLLAAGFRENDPDYVLEAIEGGEGFDEENYVTAPLLGRLIFGDQQFALRDELEWARLGGGRTQVSNRSHWARVLSRRITRVIHIPSLQDSFHLGVNGALGGMTVHNLDNWRRFTSPPGAGDLYLAEAYASEMVQDKVVLTLLDALFLQYAGGPFPAPAHVLPFFTLVMSYDPVAIDATARLWLDEARVTHGLPPLDESSGYIEVAEALGLGFADKNYHRTERIHRAPDAGGAIIR
jgi:hypothetical protein